MATAVKHDDGDEEYQQTATCDTMIDQCSAFTERVSEIMRDAQQYGFSTAFIICAQDPLNKENINNYHTVGNDFAIIGMTHRFLRVMEKDLDG